ncbi:MAG: hypothetical protein P1U32_08475 [Legionellaceae bacterium]|nr:hypothetical protein [Legionellaceae bacterium]
MAHDAVALSEALRTEVVTAAQAQLTTGTDENTQALTVLDKWADNPHDKSAREAVYTRIKAEEAVADKAEEISIWQMIKNGMKACLYAGSIVVVGLALSAAGLGPDLSFMIVDNISDAFKLYQKQSQSRLALENHQQLRAAVDTLKQEISDEGVSPKRPGPL